MAAVSHDLLSNLFSYFGSTSFNSKKEKKRKREKSQTCNYWRWILALKSWTSLVVMPHTHVPTRRHTHHRFTELVLVDYKLESILIHYPISKWSPTLRWKRRVGDVCSSLDLPFNGTGCFLRSSSRGRSLHAEFTEYVFTDTTTHHQHHFHHQPTPTSTDWLCAHRSLTNNHTQSHQVESWSRKFHTRCKLFDNKKE